MRKLRQQMGMRTVVEIVGPADPAVFEEIFGWFEHVDQVFSPFKKDSEVSRFGRGEVKDPNPELSEVLELAEQTKSESGGYFDVWHEGKFDPSGLVKGWAIHHAAEMLRNRGFKNFYVEAGGDIEVSGRNTDGQDWRIGLENPWRRDRLTHVLRLDNQGVATSGTYLLGQHIYQPKNSEPIKDVVSLTVVGPDAYEADRFATAAFAMGRAGLRFLASRGLEGFLVHADKSAEMTGGFAKLLAS